MLGFSCASSLFGLKQFGGVLAPSRASAADFEHVTRAAESEMDGPFRSLFRVGDRIQRDTLNMLLGALPSARNARAAPTDLSGSPGAGGGAQASQPPRSAQSPQPPGRPTQPTQPAPPQQQRTALAYRVNRGRLDTDCFVVIGEGLAAGMGDFALSEETQCESFPAQMARQMQTDFRQPLIQAPGVCYPVGFAKTPVLVPRPLQTTVFDRIPPAPVHNLSVPGLRLADARHLRPAQPLIRRDSHKLTALNLALGVLHFARGDEGPAPTPLEYALALRPTLALVELGYQEALEAAVSGDLSKLPGADAFRTEYSRLLAELRGAGAEVVALTIPDPFDTAYFSTLEEASNVVKADPTVLRALYGLGGDELVTVHGLHEIGFQLFGQSVGPLPDNATRSGEVARHVSARVAELNDAIATAARECGALVYDLHGLFRLLRTRSYNTGTRALTCEYLGGFYTLNGYYPGATGHAIIADELLHFLNLNYGADFPQVDVGSVSQTDPVADYRPAGGPCWTLDNLPRPGAQPPGDADDFALGGSSPDAFGSAGRGPSGWESLGQPEGESPTPAPLRLPPDLEQTLPLSKAASYFGDGIGAVNCRDQQGVQFGSCGSWLFGGLAMVDSHLSGNLRIRFTPPVNNVTRFVISFEGGRLAGDDAVLCAPQLFKMWFRQAGVGEVPGLVSSGSLDLSNGLVSDLQVYGAYASTALAALVGSNPTFPRVPITFRNESTSQYYGSAWATFEQRDDGLLDFTFYGSMFAPLGPGIRWPLNFVGPSGQFATIPAAGTVMHPHLHLSTKEPARGGECPEIPFNTIQELTLFSHNSCFGDAFTLDASQLGGKATGRSHLLGRVLLQYGARSGNTVPVAVAAVVPGGVMSELAPSPITQVFPGRLYPGPVGFDEFLRFPLRTYSLDDLAIIDDPFDISVGAVDLRTGRFVNDLLHRGFINQDLIFALLRVEPRTPGSSFNFRGPALLERGPGGGTLFRFLGGVFIPYPEGFFFPTPNLTTGFPIGPNSRLDPFLWMHAIQDRPAGDYVKSGGERDVLSSTGERFSYNYTIPQDASKRGAVFEYENHSQQGKFRLHSLAWVGFGNAQTPGREGGKRRGRQDYDTVSFTGFGVWSKDGVETLLQVAAQFSTAQGRKYVGIQVDSGNVSNVNTKPPDINDARP